MESRSSVLRLRLCPNYSYREVRRDLHRRLTKYSTESSLVTPLQCDPIHRCAKTHIVMWIAYGDVRRAAERDTSPERSIFMLTLWKLFEAHGFRKHGNRSLVCIFYIDIRVDAFSTCMRTTHMRISHG